jgi:hypothetical protein
LKRLVFILTWLINISLYSQSIEIVGGLISNKFYDFNHDDPHFSSSYSHGFGYSALIGIDDVKLEWLKLRFTLSYDKYSGGLEAGYSGLGGGNSTIADIDKSLISLGIFPLSFKIIKRIDLNFGFEFSGLISESFKGESSGWSYLQPDWSYDLNEKYTRYSALTYFGLRGKIGYDFNISDTFSISPQYSYYFGLSNEFDEFPEVAKSIRHYFCIGIKMKL